MNRGKRVLSILLALCISVSLLTAVIPPVSATDWDDADVQQRIVLNTALAYFYKGPAVQYASYYLTNGNRFKSAILRTTNNRAPEDATPDDELYTVCSAFQHDVYFNAFGEHILEEGDLQEFGENGNLTYKYPVARAANPEAANSSTSTGIPVGANKDELLAVLNNTENFCWHAAMAQKLGLIGSDGYPASEENIPEGTTDETRERYADVVCYFGPQLNGPQLNGNNNPKKDPNEYSNDPNDITRIQGQDKVAEIINGSQPGDDGQQPGDDGLQPGDVIVVFERGGDLKKPSGHAMMYVGDIDGDGQGEIIHSTGKKYNNNENEDEGDSGNVRGITQETYDHAGDGVSYGYVSGNYLSGYDLREAPSGWADERILGPDGGGSIVVEDWQNQMGAGKTYNPTRTDRTIQFTVLRPLNKQRFKAKNENQNWNNWATGNTSALGRYWLGDLCVTKTAMIQRGSTGSWENLTEKQTVLPGDSIKYVIELWNPGNNDDYAADDQLFWTKDATGNNTNVPTDPIDKLHENDQNYVNYGKYNTTKDVRIEEKIPNGASFDADRSPDFSTDSNGKIYCEESVPNGGKVTVCYTIQIPSDAVVGEKIESEEGKVHLIVNGSPSEYFWLPTKSYTHTVGAGRVTGNLNLQPGSYVVQDPGHGLGIAAAVYGNNGNLTLQSGFPTETSSLLNDLLVKDDWGSGESEGCNQKLKLNNGSLLKGIIVPGFIGGKKFESYNNEGLKTNTNRLCGFREEYLEPGDILVCANVNYETDKFKITKDNVYVFLGKNSEGTYYARFNDAGTFEIVNAPMKEIQIGDTDTKFQYSEVLTRVFLYDFFVLLRPSLATVSGIGNSDTFLTGYGDTQNEDPTFPDPTCASPAARILRNGNVVAQYATLTEALIEATPDDTITLLQDVTVGDKDGNEKGNGKVNTDNNTIYPFEIRKNITLDLNGHKISDNGELHTNPDDPNVVTTIKALIRIDPGPSYICNVTIKDDTVGSMGTINSQGIYAAVSIAPTARVTLENVDVHNVGSSNNSHRAVYVSKGTSGSGAETPILTINGGTYEGRTKAVEIAYENNNDTRYIRIEGGAKLISETNAPLLFPSDHTALVAADMILKSNDNNVNPLSGLPTEGYVSYQLSDNQYVYAKDRAALIERGATFTTYPTLTDALTNAQSGDTITLLTDINVDNEVGTGSVVETQDPVNNTTSYSIYPFMVTKDLTLDFNHHKIVDDGAVSRAINGSQQAVTVKAPIRIDGNHAVTLRNGTIESNGTIAAISVGVNANVLLEGMTVANSQEQDGGCEHSHRAVYVSKLDPNNGITQSTTTLTISGGSYSGRTNAVRIDRNDNANVSDSKTIEINNGAVLQSAAGAPLSMAKNTELTYENATAQIENVENGGFLNIYLTLTEALSAAQSGDTITLLRDVTVGDAPGNEQGNHSDKQYPFIIHNKAIVLDLNGYRISDNGELHTNPDDPNVVTTIKAPIRIDGNHAVTLKNGMVTSNGSIAAISIGGAANVTLEDLDVRNSQKRAVYVSEGSSGNLYINGGTYCGATQAVCVAASTKRVEISDSALLCGGETTVLYVGTGGRVTFYDAWLAATGGNVSAYSGDGNGGSTVIGGAAPEAELAESKLAEFAALIAEWPTQLQDSIFQKWWCAYFIG